jgi:hypothetical protein
LIVDPLSIASMIALNPKIVVFSIVVQRYHKFYVFIT